MTKSFLVIEPCPQCRDTVAARLRAILSDERRNGVTLQCPRGHVYAGDVIAGSNLVANIRTELRSGRLEYLGRRLEDGDLEPARKPPASS